MEPETQLFWDFNFHESRILTSLSIWLLLSLNVNSSSAILLNKAQSLQIARATSSFTESNLIMGLLSRESEIIMEFRGLCNPFLPQLCGALSHVLDWPSILRHGKVPEVSSDTHMTDISVQCTTLYLWVQLPESGHVIISLPSAGGPMMTVSLCSSNSWGQCRIDGNINHTGEKNTLNRSSAMPHMYKHISGSPALSSSLTQ